MPIYEYLCQECQHQLEEMQKFNDAPLTECPQCGQATLERMLSKSAFHLKGGGWYQDGYGSQSQSKPAKPDEKKTDDKKTKSSTKADSSPKSSTTQNTTSASAS